jgi:hypothetical protein
MMLHNRCRSDTLSRSSAMSTRGISRGMYFWAKMNLARASRPPGVELAARMWFSISWRLPKSGLGSMMGPIWSISSERPSSTLDQLCDESAKGADAP